uniref:Neur_chan_LBD domain-containing protein n=1 Tax=Heterorhabditis bacteriophora TaxID=37862 RepID=A0A1I7WXC8_HETBA
MTMEVEYNSQLRSTLMSKITTPLMSLIRTENKNLFRNPFTVREIIVIVSNKLTLHTIIFCPFDSSCDSSTNHQPNMAQDDILLSDAVTELLRDTFDLFNLTRLVEQEHADSLEDALNRTVLWIDASYKAEDFKLNVSSFPECKAWKRYWNITNGTTDLEGSNRTLVEETPVEEMATSLKETELVDTKKRLKKLGLNEELLEVYKVRFSIFVLKQASNTNSFLYREDEELNPDAVTLAKLARSLNEIISNTSEGSQSRTDSRFKTTQNTTTNVMYENYDAVISDKNFPTTQKTEFPRQEVKLLKESILEKMTYQQIIKTSDDTENEIVEATQKPKSAEIRQYDDDYWDYVDLHKRFKAVSPKRLIRGVTLRVKRSTGQMDGEMKDDDDDWMETVVNRENDMNVNIVTGAPEKENVVVEEEGNNTERTLTQSWIEIDATEETQNNSKEKNAISMKFRANFSPTLLITSAEAAYALSLNIRSQTFLRYEKVGLYLPGICADYVPKAIDAFNSSSFEGIEIEGPIGVNITALEAAGVNLTALAEKLRNDTEVDDILSRTNSSLKTLGGSFILPVLHKNQYDPFSAPIVFQGSAVVVKFGIYIESMSNFQTSTMDYDMDIYLMMAWRDARLVNPYDKPILVKEEEILEKIWRPDPFFANAKEAEFSHLFQRINN